MITFVKTTWRLLRTQPADGAWNMAVDDTIMESVGLGQSLPTLRLYAWQPPCLSLGYAQPLSDVDQATLAKNGWGIVRRPTGGRAILHANELTYSVIAPAGEPRLAGGVLESYQTLAQALLLALQRLTIPAEMVEKKAPVQIADSRNDNADDMNPVCFDRPSNYEITVHGKKLIGSAQARRKASVLQHGSLPLYGDLTRITHALTFKDENARELAAQNLLKHAITAQSVLGTPLRWSDAADAFIYGFGEALQLDLQETELTNDETQRANQLVEEKYAHIEWMTKT